MPCSLGVRLGMTLMATQRSPLNTLPETEFLYNRCTELYSSIAVRLPQALYTFWEVRSALYTRCTIHNDTHGHPLLGGEHSAVNGIFVDPLYGPVQLNGVVPCTCHTGSVHNLGSVVAPCTLGIRLGMTLMAIHYWAVSTLSPRELLYTRCAGL